MCVVLTMVLLCRSPMIFYDEDTKMLFVAMKVSFLQTKTNTCFIIQVVHMYMYWCMRDSVAVVDIFS